ncbi:gamma-glutamyltransferase [Bacillus subtilis]|uniref:Glutathione hydrolase proenzyme n=1 Tax=Bacillus subtilis TaxID=1423 RepID=A0AAX3RGG4_BACIU|nr:gamma-glutamyltransferase [Bacillus subtilis]MEC0363414.1 gamma-glutamyltransferase [Bacillus subtilis]WEY83581.1 gamma-glutamyltransferase [Bacillus subtilis]WEY96399.1 gamma-glutamyltransferase [Bacillus subtilis]
MKRTWNVCLTALLSVLLVAGSVPFHAEAKKLPKSYDEYKQVDVGKDGMVATAHPLASEIGADVLKKGGNAIDAAVAIQFALNVTEPMMSGIGGGGFMMVYDGKTKDTTIIDSRERAPAGATPDMFLDENGKAIPFSERVTKGTAVGVPGTLKGLEEALDKWGTRSMKQLITPSIKLAEKGFPIDSVLADAISDYQEKLSRTAAKDVFLPNGEPLKEGDTLIQKDLAKTFKLIRSNGTDAFYKGKFAKTLSDTVQDFGGSMTEKDLENYDITIDEPIWGDYQGYQIATTPPPSSGGIFLLQMLKILDDFNLSQYDVRSWEKYQLLAETMHLSYADRASYAGDPEFVNVPLKGLLHPDYIKERQQLINLDQVNKKPKAGDPWKYQEGSANYKQVEQPKDKVEGQTTHFTVADRWGNVVSYTTTIEQLFGTGIMVPDYGVILNNELTDFDAIPGGANEVQPNKRPLSSMTPTILFKDDKPVLTVGSPGGATIISSVLQTILYHIEYGMELKAAVEEPRIYTNSMSSYRYEDGVPKDVLSKLNGMGHKFGTSPVDIGNVQSISIDHENGTFKGVADSSRNGAAIGINLKRK